MDNWEQRHCWGMAVGFVLPIIGTFLLYFYWRRSGKETTRTVLVGSVFGTVVGLMYLYIINSP